jgi:predicted enzyme related to lactoylglutathione lyase
MFYLRAVILTIAFCCGSLRVTETRALAATTELSPSLAVGPQYDTAHVYIPATDFDRFVASVLATFGGMTSPKAAVTVTPVPSKTTSQLALTPSGTISVFGYLTPIPYPFGVEPAGYLVTDLDAAIKAARSDGASLIVPPFDDPIGRDAIIQWPAGVYMQLYWHTKAPHYAPLTYVPDYRVYASPDSADAFIHDFVAFSHGTVVEDVAAPGVEVGRPRDTYRRVRIESGFGKMTVLVTDGKLPYPYGRETMGYEVADLPATLKKATDAGATILVPLYASQGRQAAIVQFPGGYIAEVHSSSER